MTQGKKNKNSLNPHWWLCEASSKIGGGFQRVFSLGKFPKNSSTFRDKGINHLREVFFQMAL